MRVHREKPTDAQDENHLSREAGSGSEDHPVTFQQEEDEVQNSQPSSSGTIPEQLLKELQDELKRAQAERNLLAEQVAARQQQILQGKQQLTLIQAKIQSLKANPSHILMLKIQILQCLLAKHCQTSQPQHKIAKLPVSH